ncbi:uncharacterized protein LOC124660430 [Lolium rigidum]|uniref:uncharacterized protein LOC124660430 n=1 Tax=Lolium rigidum TaxID=89674 RepID=UPI001F5C156E|nr:uncharacterized protein LOC124660430 [Lolium rigidum]
MGNGLSPCVSMPATAPTAVRLVYWGGQTRVLLVNEEDDSLDGEGCSTAGDVAAELHPPGVHVVCPSDCFFVGLPIPITPPTERLLPGRTYFVLPAARLSPGWPSDKAPPVLTAATLAALSGGEKRLSLAGPGDCPFEYVKGGAAPLIRVLPEFIEKVITCDGASDGAVRRGKCGVAAAAASATELCSTPELKRHYAQLVGPRTRPWS